MHEHLLHASKSCKASTKQWLVSSSTPLYGMDGEFVGVLSIDRTVENMSNIINEKNLYKSQYSFIIDGYGKILVHPNQNMIQKTFLTLRHQNNKTIEITYLKGI